MLATKCAHEYLVLAAAVLCLLLRVWPVYLPCSTLCQVCLVEQVADFTKHAASDLSKKVVTPASPHVMQQCELGIHPTPPVLPHESLRSPTVIRRRRCKQQPHCGRY